MKDPDSAYACFMRFLGLVVIVGFILAIGIGCRTDNAPAAVELLGEKVLSYQQEAGKVTIINDKIPSGKLVRRFERNGWAIDNIQVKRLDNNRKQYLTTFNQSTEALE